MWLTRIQKLAHSCSLLGKLLLILQGVIEYLFARHLFLTLPCWASVSKGRSTNRDCVLQQCVKSSACPTPGCVGIWHKTVLPWVGDTSCDKSIWLMRVLAVLTAVPRASSHVGIPSTPQGCAWADLCFQAKPKHPCPLFGVGDWSSRRCPSACQSMVLCLRGEGEVLHGIKVRDEEITVCFSSIQFASNFGGCGHCPNLSKAKKPSPTGTWNGFMCQLASQDISMKVNSNCKAIDIIGLLMSEMGLELLTSFRALGDALILHFLRYLYMDRTQCVKWLCIAVFLRLHNIL